MPQETDILNNSIFFLFFFSEKIIFLREKKTLFYFFLLYISRLNVTVKVKRFFHSTKIRPIAIMFIQRLKYKIQFCCIFVLFCFINTYVNIFVLLNVWRTQVIQKIFVWTDFIRNNIFFPFRLRCDCSHISKSLFSQF